MENKNQQNSNQQHFDNFSDAGSMQTTIPGGASLSDEDIVPVLDEQDMEENHLKEEDLDDIVWDKPAQQAEELSTSSSEKDITD